MGMPGFGDAATWGPCTDPRDPRYDEGPEDAERAALEAEVEELEAKLAGIADELDRENLMHDLKEVGALIDKGFWAKAWKKLETLGDQVPA